MTNEDDVNSGDRARAGWLVYATIAGVGLLASAAVGAYLVWNLSSLVANGALGQAYFVLIVILAMSFAAFVFGAMNSTAKVTGNYLSVAAQVGGPAAGAVVIILLAFWLPPTVQVFEITVRLDGPSDPETLAKGAHFVLDIAEYRRDEAFGPSGEVELNDIPVRLRNESIRLQFFSQYYFDKNAGQARALEPGNVITVHLDPKAVVLDWPYKPNGAGPDYDVPKLNGRTIDACLTSPQLPNAVDACNGISQQQIASAFCEEARFLTADSFKTEFTGKFQASYKLNYGYGADGKSFKEWVIDNSGGAIFISITCRQ